MVLQDFSGASVHPSAQSASDAHKSGGKEMPIRFAAVAALSLATVALIFVASTSVLGQSSAVDLMDEKLSQHLMSQFSRNGVDMRAKDDIYTDEGDAKPTAFHAWTGDDSSTFDQLKESSSRPVDEAENGIHDTIAKDNARHHSWYGKWGSSSSDRTQTRWQSQLQALKAKAAARRKAEDENYFSGIYKAFGKKAGQQMMAAFEGKKVKGLHKIKIDEKALAAHKKAIAHNDELPESQASKALHKAHRNAHATAAHKAVMEKHAAHAAAASAVQGPKPTAVKEALNVAKQMEAHEAPAKDEAAAKPAAVKEQAKAKKSVDLKHPGVIADARKIKELVHEFKHAHGNKKKMLKARVMELKEDIVDDFSKVTAFGKRAKTALQRAEAKGKPPQAAHHRHGGDDSDSSSHHFVWH